jgi:hypothetical protein
MADQPHSCFGVVAVDCAEGVLVYFIVSVQRLSIVLQAMSLVDKSKDVLKL